MRKEMIVKFTYPNPPTITERYTRNDKIILKNLSYVYRSLNYTYFKTTCTPTAPNYTYRAK